MVPRLPGTAAVRPGTHQFSYPRYGGTTYPDSPYSDAAADKKLSRLCRRSVTWKCAALVLLLVVLALAALVAYLLGTYHRVIFSCLLYTSPSPRDRQKSRMPSSA